MFSRAPEARGQWRQLPRCPDGTGAARGQEVAFSKPFSHKYQLHLKLLIYRASTKNALHLCQRMVSGFFHKQLERVDECTANWNDKNFPQKCWKVTESCVVIGCSRRFVFPPTPLYVLKSYIYNVNVSVNEYQLYLNNVKNSLEICMLKIITWLSIKPMLELLNFNVAAVAASF